jgi:hypothetical protein
MEATASLLVLQHLCFYTTGKLDTTLFELVFVGEGGVYYAPSEVNSGPHPEQSISNPNTAP